MEVDPMLRFTFKISTSAKASSVSSLENLLRAIKDVELPCAVLVSDDAVPTPNVCPVFTYIALCEKGTDPFSS